MSEDQIRILKKCLIDTRRTIDKALDNNNFVEAKWQREINKNCKNTLKELNSAKKKIRK